MANKNRWFYRCVFQDKLLQIWPFSGVSVVMRGCYVTSKNNIMSRQKAMVVSRFPRFPNSLKRTSCFDNGAFCVQQGKSNRQPAILSAPAPPTDQKPDRQRINSNTADGEAKTRGELSRTDPGVQALHDLSRHGGTKPPPSYRHHGRPPSGHDTGGGGTAGGLSSKNLTSDRRGHGVALHNGGFTGAIMHTRPSAGPGDVGEHRPIKLETPPAESPRLSSARAQSWPSPSCPGWRPVEIGADGRKRRVGVYQHQRMARFEEIEQKMDSESRTRPMELHRPLSTPLPTPPLYTTSRSSTTSCASNGEPLQNDSTFDGSGAVKLEGGGRMHDVPAFAATPTNRATPTLSRQGRRRTAAEVAELLRGRYNLLYIRVTLGSFFLCYRVLKCLAHGQHSLECYGARSYFPLVRSPASFCTAR